MIAALGLLLVSFWALAVSLGGHGERAVRQLVTAPGIQQQVVTTGGGGARSGTSPFAVYVPPAAPPPAAPPPAASQPAPAPPPAQAPPVEAAHHKHGG